MDISTAASLGCKFIEKLMPKLSLSNTALTVHFRTRRCFRHSYKLPIDHLLLLQLGNLSHDLQFCLFRHFSSNFCIDSLPSESALVQARGKMLPTIFDYISKEVAALHDELLPIETYHGYRLLAGDGSTAYLPQTQACKEAFGSVKNQHGSQSYARFLLITDTLNQTCLYSKIGRCDDSELSLLSGGLPTLPAKSILILDRLFPSSALFYEMGKLGLSFVVRATADFNNTMVSFVASGLTDAIYEFCITERAVTSLKKRGYDVNCHTTIRVRFIRVTLDNGQFEYLITNVFDTVFKEDNFKYIYNCRWKVEGTIDTLKNKICLEHFSGHKPMTIMQDFYSSIAKINTDSFFQRTATQVLQQPGRETKHQYQASIALTTSLVNSFLTQCKDSTSSQIEEMATGLFTTLVRFPQPKRLGRSNPRVFKCHKARGRCYYNPNYKATG